MWEFIVKGGPLMGLIIVCSVIAFAVFIERIWHLHRARIDTDKFIEMISSLIKHNKIMEALDKCNTTPGPIAHIMKMGILKHDRTRGEIRESIMDAGIHEVPRLEKNINILATVAHISPLLGLLGTVTGNIEAFGVLGQFAGGGDPMALANGIAEALLTTAAGIVVSIPAIIFYNNLVSKVNHIIIRLENRVSELVLLLKGGVM